jgi:hypothetical protein
LTTETVLAGLGAVGVWAAEALEPLPPHAVAKRTSAVAIRADAAAAYVRVVLMTGTTGLRPGQMLSAD